MEPFRYHVYVCDQQKPEGAPCCTASGSRGMIEALRREVVAQGLANEVQITTCGSLGLCERGPNMVVYPEGVWYSGVRAEDAHEIVDSHFRQGRPVSRLVNTDQAAPPDVDVPGGISQTAAPGTGSARPRAIEIGTELGSRSLPGGARRSV